MTDCEIPRTSGNSFNSFFSNSALFPCNCMFKILSVLKPRSKATKCLYCLTMMRVDVIKMMEMQYWNTINTFRISIIFITSTLIMVRQYRHFEGGCDKDE